MSIKLESAVGNLAPKPFVVPDKKLAPATNSPIIPDAVKKHEARFAGDNLRFQLERKLSFETTDLKPKFDKVSPAEVTIKRLKKQQVANQNEQNVQRIFEHLNDEIIKGDHPLLDKLKALIDNGKIHDRLGTLETEKKIIDEHLAAVERGDTRAIAFFDAMERTNKTGDPWDMNPGDAFRNSLNPEAQRQYDETLAQLRNDPRVQFEFKEGAIDSPAMREIALRGMVAATFGRPQDSGTAYRRRCRRQRQRQIHDHLRSRQLSIARRQQWLGRESRANRHHRQTGFHRPAGRQ